MADQLLTSTPVSPHQLAKQRFHFLTSVLAGVHQNVESCLTRSVYQVERGKDALSGSMQGNPNDYIAPSDLEAPILIPARFSCHASTPKQQFPFLSIHKARTMPKVVSNG